MGRGSWKNGSGILNKTENVDIWVREVESVADEVVEFVSEV